MHSIEQLNVPRPCRPRHQLRKFVFGQNCERTSYSRTPNYLEKVIPRDFPTMLDDEFQHAQRILTGPEMKQSVIHKSGFHSHDKVFSGEDNASIHQTVQKPATLFEVVPTWAKPEIVHNYVDTIRLIMCRHQTSYGSRTFLRVRGTRTKTRSLFNHGTRLASRAIQSLSAIQHIRH